MHDLSVSYLGKIILEVTLNGTSQQCKMLSVHLQVKYSCTSGNTSPIANRVSNKPAVCLNA